MTQAEVLKELDTLNDLTNSIGRAMIVNIRAWVAAANETLPVVVLPTIKAQPEIVPSPPPMKKPSIVKRAVKKVLKRK